VRAAGTQLVPPVVARPVDDLRHRTTDYPAYCLAGRRGGRLVVHPTENLVCYPIEDLTLVACPTIDCRVLHQVEGRACYLIGCLVEQDRVCCRIERLVEQGRACCRIECLVARQTSYSAEHPTWRPASRLACHLAEVQAECLTECPTDLQAACQGGCLVVAWTRTAKKRRLRLSGQV
jgi:hypothetical protein